MRRSRSSAFLYALDALCVELQERCGLTRFSIVIERSSGPLTVTFQNELHSSAQAIARLELDVRDGEHRLGEILIEDSMSESYSAEIRRAAGDVLTRHAHALRDALPA